MNNKDIIASIHSLAVEITNYTEGFLQNTPSLIEVEITQEKLRSMYDLLHIYQKNSNGVIEEPVIVENITPPNSVEEIIEPIIETEETIITENQNIEIVELETPSTIIIEEKTEEIIVEKAVTSEETIQEEQIPTPTETKFSRVAVPFPPAPITSTFEFLIRSCPCIPIPPILI